MNYAAIKKTDVANGPGIRISLFVSGCRHHCPECFNAVTWDFEYGEPFTATQEEDILTSLNANYIKGFSFLGGEPMEPENRSTCLELARKIKAAYPDKSIWCYSGYLLEDLMAWAGKWKPLGALPVANLSPEGQKYLAQAPAEDAAELDEFLSLIDVLVDGEYMAEKMNLRLKFRGSSNQRLIDLPKSREAGFAILLPLPERS